nr:MAG TPA: hypothetical protein [Crassvirales sp.]
MRIVACRQYNLFASGLQVEREYPRVLLFFLLKPTKASYTDVFLGFRIPLFLEKHTFVNRVRM